MTDTINTDTLIRTIVSTSIRSYASGFCSHHLGGSKATISQLSPAPQSLLHNSLTKLLQDIADTIASLDEEPTPIKLTPIHTSPFFGNNPTPECRNFWNKLCNSNHGYDIIYSEFQSHALYDFFSIVPFNF